MKKLNAIGLLFQSNISSDLEQFSRGKQAKNATTGFQVLLDDENAESMRMNKSDNYSKSADNLFDLIQSMLQLLVDSEKLEEVLHHLSEEEGDYLLTLIEGSNTEQDIDAELEKLIASMLTNETPYEFIASNEEGKSLLNNIKHMIENNNFNQAWMSNPLTSEAEHAVNVEEADHYFQKQFSNLFKQAESIMANINNESEAVKDAPKLLKLIEQWTELERKHGQSGMKLIALEENQEEKQQSGWKQLINAYKRRNQLAVRNQYNSVAQVSSADIANWMKPLLGEHQEAEMIRQHPSTTLSSMPISRLEQYVMYMNQAQGTTQIDQQLMDQFQTIMNRSNFLSSNNGINQLSIALKPENLGEMLVRLTEINGEMAVKIIVSSTTTRKILESNIHQLKHMFAPQQVVIEEQDTDLFNAQDDLDEQLLEQQTEEDESGQNSGQKNQDNERDFKDQFNQLLNTEV